MDIIAILLVVAILYRWWRWHRAGETERERRRQQEKDAGEIPGCFTWGCFAPFLLVVLGVGVAFRMSERGLLSENVANSIGIVSGGIACLLFAYGVLLWWDSRKTESEGRVANTVDDAEDNIPEDT